MKKKIFISSLLLAVLAFSACGSKQAAAPVQTAHPYYQQPYAPAQPPAQVAPQHYVQGLPQSIMTTIQNGYPGAFIIDVDWEPYGYEIKISNGMELYFDRNGNLLGQGWD